MRGGLSGRRTDERAVVRAPCHAARARVQQRAPASQGCRRIARRYPAHDITHPKPPDPMPSPGAVAVSPGRPLRCPPGTPARRV